MNEVATPVLLEARDLSRLFPVRASGGLFRRARCRHRQIEPIGPSQFDSFSQAAVVAFLKLQHPGIRRGFVTVFVAVLARTAKIGARSDTVVPLRAAA